QYGNKQRCKPFQDRQRIQSFHEDPVEHQSEEKDQSEKEHWPDPGKGIGDHIEEGDIEIDDIFVRIQFLQGYLAEVVQERHNITSLVGQGIQVEVLGGVVCGMVIEVVINKGEVKTIDPLLFPEHSEVGIVRQHFVNAVGKGISDGKLRV